MAVTCSPFFRWTIALNLLPEKAEAGIIKGDLIHNRDYGQQELAKVRNNMFFDGFQNIFAGEYEKALGIFNYLIEDVPATVEEQWMLDSAAAANGITDEKYAKDYKIAVRFYRAITLLSMGNYSMAALDFSAVADRVKDVNDARMLPLTLKEGYAEFLTGACYYELSMHNKAEEAFKKALLKNPALYMAHYRLSQIYTQQKKYDMALSELNSALIIKPDDSVLHYNKGYFLSLQNKKEEALSEFEIAAGLNAHNLRAIYGSAELFENMGKNDKASEKYLLFINNAPQRDSIKIAEARLKLHSLKTK
jgi:tetratricopeptide (TPR) repeat protein